MWLYPRPARDQIYEIYKDMSYYSNKEFFCEDGSKIYGYVDYLAERLNKQYWYKKIIEKTKNKLQESLGTGENRYSWLDVGCGLGFLMDMAFDYGFRVYGVEFSQSAIQYIKSKYTFPVEYGMLSEIEFKKRYDVISMFDVIEHLLDPISDLKKLRQMISDRGYLLIQTMDSESFVSRLLGKKLEDFRRIREHLYFFSRSSLKEILEHCGWEVTEMRSIGQTFQVAALVDRISVYSKKLSRFLRFIIYPKWLLDANIYVNPGTKMLVYARPKKGFPE
jgi:2-polyprenyl-3-methyl-5-hydroxy-6-metoxy-1,4-benzoquinol methylase